MDRGRRMLRNVTDLDLRLLQIFATIVECGGFSAAQAELNMGQSTISTHIATLETRLGYRLCERGKGGFKLTEKGQRVLAASRALFGSIDRFRDEVQSLAGRLVGELAVGLVDNIATLPGAHVKEAIARFCARDQEVKLNFFVNSPTELERAVIDDQLDLAIAYFGRRLPSLEYIDLYTERVVICCGARHPLFGRVDATAAEIEAADWVKRGYVLPGTLLPVCPARFSAIAHHMEAVAHLILAGTHIGYLPEHYAAQWAACGAMRTLAPETLGYDVVHSLITHTGRPRSEALQALIDDIVAVHAAGA